eukprot:TRINITY_DN83315_c0_g1_i1.p1 TRINITY_DN83315_c0_g1~~TRINITY_DN83315_c0_g1_i1.p1  ORF type:complete len:368 (-),score=115.77 TRINITY_DN83315_c0_g1_i1:43-1110(-)
MATLLERGQQLLQEGQAAAAVELLKEAAAAGSLDLDGHLLLAEALWQQAGPAGSREALDHYEAARDLARAAADTSKEATVCLGHGFALLQLKEAVEARVKLLRAQELAEADGNAGAVQFIASLLKQAEASMSPAEAATATWQSWAEAYCSSIKRPILFMRGSVKQPLDEGSARGVAKLKEAGVHSMKVVDVYESSVDLPAGLQTYADIAIEFPQLYLKAAPVKQWLELPVSELRSLLEKSGVVMKEGGEEGEACHGAFSEGLEPWEVALVELVSKEGAGAWQAKAETLAKRELAGAPSSAEALEAEWTRLAPLVKEKLEVQPEMPCGHSCNTCPTKHDCQLHDAVGHVRDIEDLI